MKSPTSLETRALVPPCDPELARTLRQIGEDALAARHRLTRDHYSTGRFLNPNTPNNDEVLRNIVVDGELQLRCEAPSKALDLYCADHGLTLANKDQYLASVTTLELAVSQVIHRDWHLRSAVAELAWQCHLVRPPDDAYDVSFSDPDIPFSIFVSIPEAKNRRSILRVAENLVHETMHLQLSLFEQTCPLIDSAVPWSLYSPWKSEQRPAQGILHGLYVFVVLRWMWGNVLTGSPDADDQIFAQRRIEEIGEEIEAVRDLDGASALTKDGRELVAQLYAWFDSVHGR